LVLLRCVWFVFGNLVFENREEGIPLTPLATGLW